MIWRIPEDVFICLVFARISWFFTEWDLINGRNSEGHVGLFSSSHSSFCLSEGAHLLKTNSRKKCWEILTDALHSVEHVFLLSLLLAVCPSDPGARTQHFSS